MQRLHPQNHDVVGLIRERFPGAPDEPPVQHRNRQHRPEEQAEERPAATAQDGFYRQGCGEEDFQRAAAPGFNQKPAGHRRNPDAVDENHRLAETQVER